MLVSSTTKGEITLNSDGSFTYVPGPSFSGSDSFTYKALSDGELTDVTTVTLNGDSFTIVGDDIIPETDYTADVEVLGCAVSAGGAYDIPVTVRVSVGGTTVEPFGDWTSVTQANVNNTGSHSYTLPGTYTSGTALSATVKFWKKHDSDSSGSNDSDWYEYRTISSGSADMMVLKDGDQAPNLDGFLDQGNLVSFLQGYINSDNVVTLNPDQAIMIYEVMTNSSSSAYDMQDAVLLLTINSQ